MTEFLDPVLYCSIIPTQAFQWILIVCQKVLRVCYSFLQKEEVQQNSIEIPKNFQSQDNKGCSHVHYRRFS